MNKHWIQCLGLAAALCAQLPAIAVERVEQGALVMENIPPIPEEIRAGLRQYSATRSARFSGWLPEQGLLISTRFGQTSQLHRVQKPLGMREQLTFFTEPVYRGAISRNPNVHGLVYARDEGGSENYQLYFLDLQSGQHRLLSDGRSRNGGVRWAPDGKRFAYSSTRRNQADTDIWVHDTRTGKDELVLDEGGYWFVQDWSDDGQHLLVQRYISINESQLKVLDLRTRQLTGIDLGEEKASVRSARFDRDGTHIFLVTDAGTDFPTLRRLNLRNGRFKALTTDQDWGVGNLARSRDGRYLAWTHNVDGIDRLRVLDLKRGKYLKLPEMPAGVIGGLEFHPYRAELGFHLSAANSPGDVWSLDLSHGKARLQRWTRSETGGLPESHFVLPELIRFQSFDGLDIPAFYYRPRGDGPFPVLVDIHGGPEGQERPVFNAFIQYLVNEMQVAVIAPNVRGSSGYGKRRLLMDNGYRREDSVKDIGALLDWVAARKELDSRRVVVYGGSYGGYMVLASLVHYNDRLAGGVDIVGISNFVTFLKNTKGYRRNLRRPEYGDERDEKMRAFLESISPANHADKISKPLFIIQGLNDPRVPASEAEQILAAVRANGGEAWYLLARDEGHGFRKKSNRDFMRASVVLFLRKVFGLESP